MPGMPKAGPEEEHLEFPRTVPWEQEAEEEAVARPTHVCINPTLSGRRHPTAKHIVFVL